MQVELLRDATEAQRQFIGAAAVIFDDADTCALLLKHYKHEFDDVCVAAFEVVVRDAARDAAMSHTMH